MVQFEGKYVLEKNENYKEYLIEYGLSESVAAMAEAYGKEITVSVDGKKYVFDDGANPSVFTLNEEYDEPIPVKQIVLKSMAKLDGNKIIITSKSPEKDEGTRIHEFTDSQYILTMTRNNITAKRYYKRG
ncbi:hypothetical protein RN001_005185 [Aquatica leii]|uniref:Uncharacterized protein n=1 Tax=Aquatica leii TaxID=1421715 RepID=A0AAN7SAG3_9COLE|nr:hypothetical protein RN001_005185 [Aquatica leii]